MSLCDISRLRDPAFCPKGHLRLILCCGVGLLSLDLKFKEQGWDVSEFPLRDPVIPISILESGSDIPSIEISKWEGIAARQRGTVPSPLNNKGRRDIWG